uniref:Uncharacterized protein n=1 Tax=Oryza sativa subsp. japonica TaxID=39947 RepID=Q6H7D8_ORYSJ|nr:hypothetical protein [Oryza sativa Japonica Group]
MRADVSTGECGADKRGPPVSDTGERERGGGSRAHCQRHGRWKGRRRHVAAGPTAPIYPRVDRTAVGAHGRGTRARRKPNRRPWRRRRSAHAAAVRMRQRRKATADGDRPAAESGG